MFTEFIKFIILVIPTFIIVLVLEEYLGSSVVLIVAIPVYFIAYVAGRSKMKSLKCRDSIDVWANNEGYKIVTVDRSWNPFRFRTSSVQYQYSVVVQDSDRNNHYFTIVLGDWWFGLLKNSITVTVNKNV